MIQRGVVGRQVLIAAEATRRIPPLEKAVPERRDGEDIGVPVAIEIAEPQLVGRRAVDGKIGPRVDAARRLLPAIVAAADRQGAEDIRPTVAIEIQIPLRRIVRSVVAATKIEGVER